jgi:RHS repeat-associated protein
LRVETEFAYNLRFPGQISMGKQNYHRNYDPVSGRCGESDPIGLKGGINTYAYGGDNPAGLGRPEGADAAGAWISGVGYPQAVR